MLANRERLIWNMKIRGSLDYSEHKMVEYRITTWTSGFLQLYEQQRENQGKGTPGAEWGRRPDEKGMENAKVLGAHFTSLSTGVISPHFLLVIPASRNCRALRLEGKSGPWKIYHWWVRTKLGNLKQTCTSPWNLTPKYCGCWPVSLWGHFQLPLKGQGELACLCGLEKSKYHYYLQQEQGGRAGELTSLTSVTGVVIKQIILEIIAKHMKNKKMAGLIQHGFMKGK